MRSIKISHSGSGIRCTRFDTSGEITIEAVRFNGRFVFARIFAKPRPFPYELASTLDEWRFDLDAPEDTETIYQWLRRCWGEHVTPRKAKAFAGILDHTS